jgi:DNA invertase Pin-like site-specific DNA recombinase
MATIGYARISTSCQSTDLQRDALLAAGCSRIFSDEMSGARTNRPGLNQALDYVREGDTLVFWRLDRVGRDMLGLVKLFTELESRGVAVKSLTEHIDTSSPSGKLIFHIFSCLAAYERDLIKERVNAGIAAAKKRGRIGGRPKAVTAAKARSIRAMRAQGLTTSEILESAQISRATLFRFLRADALARSQEEQK